MAQSPFLEVSSEFQPELTDIQRKQKLAELLTQRGMQTPQGQMVSGRFVKPNPLEYVANLANIYAGQKMMSAQEERQQALAKAIREQGVTEATGIMEALAGTPAQQQILGTETANLPQGQTAVDDEGNPTLVQAARAAQAPNPQLAMAKALIAETPAGRALLPSVMERALPKDFDLNEGQIRYRTNPLTNKIEEVAKGGEKYHPPIAVDTGSGTVLLDPKTMKPVAQYGKSVAGHVLETENGPMLVDTRTGQARPIMANGQAVTGGKTLTESQSNATAFGIRAKEADKILAGLEAQGTRVGGAGQTPWIGGALNWASTEKQQATAQARKNFVTAVLRKESGASISPTEFANEEAKYFPQLGDSPSTVLQKQKARETAIKALELQAGPGAKAIQAHNPNLSEIAPAAVGKQPKVIDFNSLPQ